MFPVDITSLFHPNFVWRLVFVFHEYFAENSEEFQELNDCLSVINFRNTLEKVSGNDKLKSSGYFQDESWEVLVPNGINSNIMELWAINHAENAYGTFHG